MPSHEYYTRRRFLQFGTAVGVSTILAGCAGPSDDDEPEAEEGTGNGQDQDDDDGHEATDDDNQGDDDT